MQPRLLAHLAQRLTGTQQWEETIPTAIRNGNDTYSYKEWTQLKGVCRKNSSAQWQASTVKSPFQYLCNSYEEGTQLEGAAKQALPCGRLIMPQSSHHSSTCATRGRTARQVPAGRRRKAGVCTHEHRCYLACAMTPRIKQPPSLCTAEDFES